MASGLKTSCPLWKYFGEVIARHRQQSKTDKKLMVFITGLLYLSFGLKSYLMLRAMLCNFPGEKGGFVNESDISFVQFYSFQKKDEKTSYFPEEKVAESISFTGIFQICLSPSVSQVELPVKVFQKLVINFLRWPNWSIKIANNNKKRRFSHKQKTWEWNFLIKLIN